MHFSKRDKHSNGVIIFIACLCAVSVSNAGEDAGQRPVEPPIVVASGEVGELLRKWYAEGTAAGNHGDHYDNRDREHSGLNLKPYPQLQRIQYTQEELDKRADWALFGGVRKTVTFGNSSTSAGAYQGGSNPRRAYSVHSGLNVLYQQYTHNNLYIYPEHRDHDSGHNGVADGWGDLYPANTPYLIISQGSSGSDQPFMRAIPFTLAAFQPAVKKKLIESGLLMPVVQMIFRMCNTHLADPERDYLTAKAHPTVFEGPWVDVTRMIKLAHDILPENIPPLVKLKVVAETAPLQGLDYFEPGATEILADTPCVVARIFRGRQFTRTITVSAEESLDLNNKSLSYHWVVLRGDQDLIKINKKNESGSIAEIQVSYHDRRPVAPGSALESNRVDIGVFAHNGVYFSPPSFVTYFFLDHEARAYDEQRRILEIGYKTGETTMAIASWPRLFELFKDGGEDSWPRRLLREQFSKDEIGLIRSAADTCPPLLDALAAAQEMRKSVQRDLDAAMAAVKEAETKAPESDDKAQRLAAASDHRKKSEQLVKDAQKNLDDAGKKLTEYLNRKQDGLAGSLQSRFDSLLQRLTNNPEFIFTNQEALNSYTAAAPGAARKGALTSVRARLVLLGLASEEAANHLKMKLVRVGDAPSAERATRFERAMLARATGEILANVMFPGVLTSTFRVNYVAPEISEPPYWRDVYQYDAAGHEAGWIRYGDSAPKIFNREGLLVVKTDAHGRCTMAQSVNYQPENTGEQEVQKKGWPHWRETRQNPGTEIKYYEYSDDNDHTGKVLRTTVVTEPKQIVQPPEK